MPEEILKALLITSVAGSGLALAITLIRPLTKKVLGYAWHYYIWLTVLLVMMLPVRFSIPSSEPVQIPGITTEQIQTVPTTEVVTENSPPKVNTDNFTAMSGRVTAKLSETNLRTGPTVNGTEIVYTLKKGEFVERTGERNGWTRVSYDGQTLYAVSSYLITEQEYNAE